MYISAISSISQNKSIPQVPKNQKVNAFQLQPQLTCDVVSFSGNFLGKFKTVLYRTISRSEFDELLKPNGYIGGHKYVTGNPKGWGARDWGSGFKHGQEDHYFVEFKKDWIDAIDVYDASDYAEDSRFVITRGYSLDDVQAIREGTNSHGKVVWSKDPEVKLNDIREKCSSIFRLLKTINKASDESVLDNAMIELASYAKEFPQVVQPLLEKAKGDSDFAYKLLYVINKTEDKSYYDFVRTYFEKFSKNPNKMKIHEMSLHYLAKYGSNDDLDLLLDVMQKDRDIMYHTYGFPLSKLLTEKDIPKMLDILHNARPAVQNAILNGFIYGADEKLAADIVRDILKQYSSIEKSVAKRDGDLKSLLATCVEFMFKCGKKQDIPLLKNFTDLGIFTDVDFKALIKALEE